MAMPGKSESHHATPSVLWPRVRMLPQLGVGGCTPMPRKDSADSTSTAEATPKVAATSTGAMALGRMCRKMIRGLLAPMAFTASTKSRSFRLKNSARTNLVIPIHEVSPITAMMLKMLGSRKAITARIRKNEEKPEHDVYKRMMIVTSNGSDQGKCKT